MTQLLYLPFIIQGIMMGFDEKIHKKRGLGAWERLGHPLDTLTVFVPLSMAAINEYSEGGLISFIILAIFSCLFITKDEFIHSKECNQTENWIHSMLFILHPMIFVCTAILWKYHPTDDFPAYQAMAVGAFMVYQVMRWSLTWKEHLR
jgi:hypothetical protein